MVLLIAQVDMIITCEQTEAQRREVPCSNSNRVCCLTSITIASPSFICFRALVTKPVMYLCVCLPLVCLGDGKLPEGRRVILFTSPKPRLAL